MQQPQTGQYSPLFQPASIGTLTLPNRLIMAAMGNGLAGPEGEVTEKMLDYYLARARGGVGMIVTQFFSVSPFDIMPYSLQLNDDRYIKSAERLISALHKEGVKAALQLMHPGLLFLVMRSIPEGVRLRLPSCTPWMKDDKPYKEVSVEEIGGYVQDFAAAAGRAYAAGADAVELHACHGCLVSSFLSPAINRRTDGYGGSPAGRARFACEIIEAMRKTVGSGFPLMVRIDGVEDVAGGVSEDEVLEQALLLEKAGTDAVSISSGPEFWSALMTPSYLTEDCPTMDITRKVKKKVHVPVIAAGKIPPQAAARAVEEGSCDFVALGRPLLADPGLPDKLRSGSVDEIVPCLYCNNCMGSQWSSCTVNPFLYREAASLEKASVPKKVMVVGGGIAGMVAALLMARKGHNVSLYEKRPAVGGQWALAASMPCKERYCLFIDYLITQLERLGVSVVTGTEVDAKMVRSLAPDTVIIAAGSVPKALDTPGADGVNVVQAYDVIAGRASVSGGVVVIGASMLSLETAVMLAERGCKVTVVSHGKLGGRRGPNEKVVFRALLRRMQSLSIPLYLNSPLLEISPDAVTIDYEGELHFIPCDAVVTAIGVQAQNGLEAELRGVVPEVYTVGDCQQPGNAAQATYGAASLMLKLQ